MATDNGYTVMRPQERNARDRVVYAATLLPQRFHYRLKADTYDTIVGG